MSTKRKRDDLTVSEITQALCEIETKFLDYIKLIFPHPTFKPTALWNHMFSGHESMTELIDKADDLMELLWDLCDVHIEPDSMEHCPRCKTTLNDSDKCPNGHVWHEEFGGDRVVLCTEECLFCRFRQFLDHDTCRLNRCWNECAYDYNHDSIRLNQERYIAWGSKIPDWMSKLWA